MDLAAIRAAVKRQFGDESGALITNADIDRWANDGQLHVARRTEVLQQKEEINSVADQQNYSLTDEWIKIRKVTYEGRVLQPITLEELDNSHAARDANAQSGTPIYYYEWGEDIYLYPAPASAGVSNIDVWYVAAPEPLVNPGDVPEIPTHMHEDIVRYCLMRAKELDEDYGASDRLAVEMEGRLAESQEEAQNKQADSYPAVRLVPGD